MLLQHLHKFYIFYLFLNVSIVTLIEGSPTGSESDILHKEILGIHKYTKRQSPIRRPHFGLFDPRPETPPESPRNFNDPRMKDTGILKATCNRIKVYNEQDITSARDDGCVNLPFKNPSGNFKLAEVYIPKDRLRQPGSLYTYPLRRRQDIQKNPQDYGHDRIVLDEQCNIIKIVKEIPKARNVAAKTGRFILRKPNKPYNQNDYRFMDCAVTRKPRS